MNKSSVKYFWKGTPLLATHAATGIISVTSRDAYRPPHHLGVGRIMVPSGPAERGPTSLRHTS